MQTLHFEATIDAPVETVWHTMLDEDTYREWAGSFQEGSHYTGGWQKGEEIRFLGPDPRDENRIGGMIGVIVESREFGFVSIEYTGMVDGAVDDTTSDEARMIIGTHESYTFAPDGSATRLTVDIEVDDDWVPAFEEMWPRALVALTALAEAA